MISSLTRRMRKWIDWPNCLCRIQKRKWQHTRSARSSTIPNLMTRGALSRLSELAALESEHTPPPRSAGKAAWILKQALPDSISLLRGTRPARILLLDDEPSARDSIKRLLFFYFKDFITAEASSGWEGWWEISQRVPDLLITDLNHPWPRLEEMLHVHRLFRGLVRFPIIVASAVLDDAILRQRLLSFPTFDIVLLDKPFAAADLKAKVLECLPSFPCGIL